MTDSKTAKKIEVVPCPDHQSRHAVTVDGKFEYDLDGTIWCAMLYDRAQAKAAELAATELVEPAPRPRVMDLHKALDESLAMQGRAASSPVARPQPATVNFTAVDEACCTSLAPCVNHGAKLIELTDEPAARVEQPTLPNTCVVCGGCTNLNHSGCTHDPCKCAPAAPVVEQRELDDNEILRAALSRLSRALGNPAVIAHKGESIESKLIDFAIERLAASQRTEGEGTNGK